MPSLNIQLLGTPQIALDGAPITIRRSKVLALLVYLAVSGEPQRRDTLATLLWPESGQSQARTYLRNELSILNRTLGGGWLAIEGETVGLRPGVALDVSQFQQQLTDFERADGATSHALTQAIALYRDDFLLGFTLSACPAFDEWQFFHTESLRQALAGALTALVALLQDQLDNETAIPYARRWLALDPLHEPAHQTLMRLYARSGRQAAALRQYDECQRILKKEWGVEPDGETHALLAAIRAKELQPVTVVTVATDASTVATMDGDLPLYQEQAVELRPLFVGRESQLANLAQAFAQTQRGQGQLRLITGEAGAGKSALAAEFIQRTVAAQAQVVVALGMCDAQTGALDPYLPFREALLALLLGNQTTPLLDRAEPAAQPPPPLQMVACRAFLEHGPHLLPLFAPPAQVQTILHCAQRAGWQGKLPDAITAAPTLEQSRIFEQVVAVLQTIAAHAPLLLVLEDLHWADSGSVGLLFRLARQLDATPIMVIGTYRPEVLTGGAPEVASAETHPLQQMLLEVQRTLGDIQIDLEAARIAEGQRLVDGVLDAEPNHLDATFRQALHHQTNGHPLFVVELIQDLKKSGALIQNAQGQWVIAAALDWLNLPTRVEGAIAGRMAHLRAEQRWWLTIAAVMGEHFLVEVVAHVAGVDPRELVQSLSASLQEQHRLVEAEGVDRLAGQRLTRYRFRHNLMQVYLYERLDPVQRVYLHEDVAGALESVYGADASQMALALAHHYETAGVTAKAVEYLFLAGEQAMHISSYDEAKQLFQQTLTLLDELPPSAARDRREMTIQTLLGQVWTVNSGNGVPEVGDAYTRALTLARQLGETRQVAQLLVLLTYHAQMRSEIARAQAYGEEALGLMADDQEPELVMQVSRTLAMIAHWTGQKGDALAHYERVIAFYRRQRPHLQPDQIAQFAFVLALGALSLAPYGYPERAVQQAKEGLALAQAQSDQFWIAACTTHLAYIYTMWGDWQHVLAVTKEAIVICQTYGFVQARTLNEMNQGLALAMLGQVEAGERLARAAIAEREAINSPAGNQSTWARLAEAYGRAGRVAEGLALMDEVWAKLATTIDREWEARYYLIQGDLLLRQELADAQLAAAQQEAETYFRQGVELAHHNQARLWEARTLASLCRLHYAQGRNEGYGQQLAERYAWFTEGFETEDLREVRAVLQEIGQGI